MRKFTFTSSDLKWIAIITMTIDHIGAFILDSLIPATAYISLPDSVFDLAAVSPGWRPIYVLMLVTRLIGRLAFPLFCFLLVQGFFHSRRPKVYALRLFAFSLLSEPFFDLANNDKLWDPSSQNVFFTLFFGLLLLMLVHQNNFSTDFKMIGALLITTTVWLINCDYSLFGLGLIALFGFMTTEEPHTLTKKPLLLVALGFYLFYQVTACFTLPILARYNGERGKRQGIGFYIYYPLHLAAFWALTAYRLGR